MTHVQYGNLAQFGNDRTQLLQSDELTLEYYIEFSLEPVTEHSLDRFIAIDNDFVIRRPGFRTIFRDGELTVVTTSEQHRAEQCRQLLDQMWMRGWFVPAIEYIQSIAPSAYSALVTLVKNFFPCEPDAVVVSVQVSDFHDAYKEDGYDTGSLMTVKVASHELLETEETLLGPLDVYSHRVMFDRSRRAMQRFMEFFTESEIQLYEQ